MIVRAGRLGLLVAAAALVLGGCNGDDTEVTPSPAAPATAAPATSAAPSTTTSAAPQPSTTTTAPPSPEERTFVGVDGVETTIGDISRIVSLNGDLTEIIFELGLGENIVAVDITTSYPPEAAALGEEGNLVGFGQALSPEAVLRFDPTLVIGDEQVAPPEAIEQLRGAGVPVVILELQTTLDGIATKIGQVAEILAVPAEGQALTERVMADIDAARSLAASAESTPKVAYIYVRGPQIVLLFGEDMATQAMIEGAGAIDAGVAAGVVGPASLTPEALVAAAPDVIVLSAGGLESLGGIDALLEIPGIAETPAGRDRAFLPFEEAYFFNLGPRAGQALDELVRALYPGIGG